MKPNEPETVRCYCGQLLTEGRIVPPYLDSLTFVCPVCGSSNLGRIVKRSFDLGKHLYWKALGPKGAAKAVRLGLVRSDYPCVDGVMKAHRAHQHEGSGASPASTLHFHVGKTEEAGAFVRQHHYSHSLPAAVISTGTLHLSGGLFGDFGECVAACVFGLPATQWSEPVLELARLVRISRCRVPLTKLIRLCCSQLKADGFDLLVSYADTEQGHHGGIYQAAGWNYSGIRCTTESKLMINGQKVHRRSVYQQFGTCSLPKVQAILNGHAPVPSAGEQPVNIVNPDGQFELF